MKDIVFFDLETTSSPKNHSKVRIIEIACVKIDENLNIKDKLYFRCNNDDVPISKEAFEIHGISEEDVMDCPTFSQVAKQVFDFFDGCDIGGHYCTYYDAPILFDSFLRAGLTWNFRDLKVYDTYTIYKKYHSGKLGELYKRYTGKDLEDAHSADADTMATVEVYRHQIAEGQSLDETELGTYSDRLDIVGNFKTRVLEDGKKEVYVDFGKYKGKSVMEVDPSYLEWVAGNVDGFPIDTRHYARTIASKLNNR